MPLQARHRRVPAATLHLRVRRDCGQSATYVRALAPLSMHSARPALATGAPVRVGVGTSPDPPRSCSYLLKRGDDSLRVLPPRMTLLRRMARSATEPKSQACIVHQAHDRLRQLAGSIRFDQERRRFVLKHFGDLPEAACHDRTPGCHVLVELGGRAEEL